MELWRIDEITEVESLRGIMRNARLKGSDEHYNRSLKRIIWLECEKESEKYDDKVDKKFNSFLVAYEEILRENNNGHKKRSRMRQAVKNRGVAGAIEHTIKKKTLSDGFLRLIELDMPELTLEHMVVENSESFADDVVESARQRLSDYS
jgi:hypothetical protein